MFLLRERDVWDQLRQQKDLLANANELLSARSAEAEDLRLRCADMKAEAAMAQEQAALLVVRIKELEEELTRVAGERDTFRSRAEEATASTKVIAGQLSAEQGAHLLMKGALNEALKVAEASRVDALAWKKKCEGESRFFCFICFSYVRPLTPRCGTELEKEASRAAEASRVEVQCWKEKAEASQVEVQRWKEKTEGESRRASALFGLFLFCA